MINNLNKSKQDKKMIEIIEIKPSPVTPDSILEIKIDYNGEQLSND